MGSRDCKTSHLPGESLLLKVTCAPRILRPAPSFQHDTLPLVFDRFVRLECAIHEQQVAFDTTFLFFGSLDDSSVLDLLVLIHSK